MNEPLIPQTELKRIELALQQSEQRYRAVAEMTSDYVWSAMLQSNGQMYVEWAAGPFEAITGYTVQELEDLGGWPVIVHPEHLQELNVGMEAVFNGQTTVGEFRIVTKSGEVRWLRFYSQPNWDSVTGKVCGFLGATQDITERKRMEEALHQREKQLRQVQKMEAIGRLAGGIAHDFNNLLTAILSYTELVEMSLDAEDPPKSIKEDVTEIKNAAEKAAALTHQLLAFSRQQVLQPKSIKLNHIVTNIQKLLLRLIGEDIELVTLTEANLYNILADSGQIEQVIVNLAVNARDAMPNGGKLILETKNVVVEAKQYQGIVPGPYVLLRVSDTGLGIPENVKYKIFEPFFTTKEQGQGTGLGLATVYGIVKQSGGFIELQSEEQVGTVFSVYLPKTEVMPDYPDYSAVDRKTEINPPAQTKTILVVEDEIAVRKLICRVLAENGYQLLEAQQADQALTIEANYQYPIHLLIADVKLPGKSGGELAALLLRQRPHTKVLYISGYTEGLIDKQTTDLSFMQKPFTPRHLVQRVQQLLS